MDKKRWVLTAIVVAVVVNVLEGIFHPVFLGKEYALTAAIWRPMAEMQKMMPWGWASTLVVAFILYYIFHKGYEGKGSHIAEGLRFGFIIGLFTSIPMSIWTYIMMPVTTKIAFGWFAISMIDMLVAGAIIGLLYKRREV